MILILPDRFPKNKVASGIDKDEYTQQNQQTIDL